MTICFSGNVPIEIGITEVHIDHLKAYHLLFSMDKKEIRKNDKDRIV